MGIKVRRACMRIFLIFTLLCGSAAGCFNNSPQGGTSPAIIPEKTKYTWLADQSRSNTPIEITALYQDETSYPYRADWIIWKEIADRTGITIKPYVVPYSDYLTQINAMLAAKNAPDFISRMELNNYDYFTSSDELVAINQYVDRLPAFSAKLKAWKCEEQFNDLKQFDGNVYILPGMNEIIWVNVGMGIRTDILEKHGLKIPEDYLELYDLLKKLKTLYPNQYIWSDKWNGNGNGSMWGASWGCGFGEWFMGDGSWYDEASNAWTFNATSENYKTYLKYMARLVSEKIYDPESFTHTSDQLVEKLSTGKAFISASNMNEISEWNDFGIKQLGTAFRFELIVPPSGPVGKVGARVNNLFQGILIPSTSVEKPYFEAMLGFLDWLYYSEEAITLANWGVEGVTYQTTGDVRTPLPNIKYKWINPNAPVDIRKNFGIDNFFFCHTFSKKLLYELMPLEQLTFQENYQRKMPSGTPFPKVRYTPLQQNEHETLSTNLANYTNMMYMKFILGQVNLEAGWADYVEECENRGSVIFMELVNKAYAEN